MDDALILKLCTPTPDHNGSIPLDKLVNRVRTTVRRALRAPVLRDAVTHPPAAITLSAIATLSNTTVSTVHTRYLTVAPKPHTITHSQLLATHSVLVSVISTDTTSVSASPSARTPNSNPSPTSNANPAPIDTPPHKPSRSPDSTHPNHIVHPPTALPHLAVALVPSPRLPPGLAARLAARVRAHGGQAVVLATGLPGLQAAAAAVTTSQPSKTISAVPSSTSPPPTPLPPLPSTKPCLVIADSTLAARLPPSVRAALDIRPARWLSDSLRAGHMRPASRYVARNDNDGPYVARNPGTSYGENPVDKKDASVNIQVQPSKDDEPIKRRDGIICGAKRARVLDVSNDDNESDDDCKPVKRMRTHDVSDVHVIRTDAPNECTGYGGNDDARSVVTPKSCTARWACERASVGESDMPANAHIANLLSIVHELASARGEHFRAHGYVRAIARIRGLPYELLTLDDARRLAESPGIGHRLGGKIEEIIRTGRLRAAEAALTNVDAEAMRELCGVWGIGPVKAVWLMGRGIRDVKGLREAVKKEESLLDARQHVGLRVYEDLLKRIPREEVAELEMYVRRVVREVDFGLEITVAGSYLRGKSSCGDVDILIHGERDRVRKGFEKVKMKMRKDGVITDDLVDGRDKYFGVFRLPGRAHGRVDLFAVSREEFAYALLTYTGSAVFNRSMRAKARALGYSLSHKGLQRVRRLKDGKVRLVSRSMRWDYLTSERASERMNE